MATPKNDKWLDETIDSFLSGELDTVEGEQDAVEMWKKVQENPKFKSKYDALVSGLRLLAHQTGRKSFHDAEADALWPLIMGHVAEDARQRSGLSKQALTHLAVPDLVASITKALSGYTERTKTLGESSDEVVFETPIAGSTATDLQFSITSVNGEVSLRLYREDIDMRCRVSDDEVKSNVEVANWESVSDALSQLSKMTAKLLGDEALVNGRIAIREGRAEVRLNPMDVIVPAKK